MQESGDRANKTHRHSFSLRSHSVQIKSVWLKRRPCITLITPDLQMCNLFRLLVIWWLCNLAAGFYLSLFYFEKWKKKHTLLFFAQWKIAHINHSILENSLSQITWVEEYERVTIIPKSSGIFRKRLKVLVFLTPNSTVHPIDLLNEFSACEIVGWAAGAEQGGQWRKLAERETCRSIPSPHCAWNSGEKLEWCEDRGDDGTRPRPA